MLTQAKTFFLKISSTVLLCSPPACDSTSGNLHKTSLREKSRGVYLPLGRLFFELFDDISLTLNMKRLCLVVDSLVISAAKVKDCVIFAQCWQVCMSFAKVVC